MQFIKTHLVSLASGLVAVVAVALLALGMTRDTVREQMQKRVSEAGEIGQLQADPKNENVIAAEKLKGEKFQKEFEAVLKEAYDINKRTPLIESVFPKPDSEARRFEFQIAYAQAIAKLPQRMVGGDIPNESDIEDERINIAEEQKLEAEKQEGGAREQSITERLGNQPPVAAPGVSIGGPAGGGRFGGGRMGMGAPMMAPGMTNLNVPQGDPKFDPTFRAIVTRAKSIRVYVSPASFFLSPIIEVATAPKPDEMWYAQMGLWIQEDIVNAIAALNNDAARKVASGDVFVEHTPVKRLEKVRILGYVRKDGIIPFPSTDGAQQPDLRPTFTDRVGDDQIDVVRFTVVVVVDQRDLLRFIDAVCRTNFYHCTHVEYVVAPPEAGYLYGTAPVIRATIDFEGYFARKAYVDLMPPEVLAQLGGGQPQP
jgi:hypothetical protein